MPNEVVLMADVFDKDGNLMARKGDVVTLAQAKRWGVEIDPSADPKAKED